MATLIKVNGDKENLEIPEKEGLEILQKAVGGYIEPIYLSNGEIMLVDEEGLLKSKERNETASLLSNRGIVGDVVVCSRKEFR